MRNSRTWLGLAAVFAVALALGFIFSQASFTLPSFSKMERKVAQDPQSRTDLFPEDPVEAVEPVARECAVTEVAGKGTADGQVTSAQWKKVMLSFHRSKRELTEWLARNSKEISPELRKKMEAQINELQIQRPPVLEEGELNWRGILVLAHEPDGRHIVRMGSGWIELFLKHPERAQFELTRTMAQTWAPCTSDKTALAWTGVLGCLGVKQTTACDSGMGLESGWAVSTALAAMISPPGCSVPALKSVKLDSCLARFGTLSAGDHSVKEARK